MEKIRIENIEELEDRIENVSIDKDVCVVGCYDTIVNLLNSLIKNTNFKLINCILEDPDCGYKDAYYLETYGNNIWVDCGCNEDGYLHTEYDIAFVEEDFTDDFLELNDSDNVIEFGFGEEDQDHDGETVCMDNDRCGFCYCVNNEHGYMKFRYKGTKKLSDKDIEKIIDDNFT